MGLRNRQNKVHETQWRERAIAERREVRRNIAMLVASLFTDDVDPEVEAVHVKENLAPLFQSVTVVCACRGVTDAASVTDYWNDNLKSLRSLFRRTRSKPFLMTSCAASTCRSRKRACAAFWKTSVNGCRNGTTGLN